MAWYTYAYKAAFDPQTLQLAQNATGQVYAVSDTAFTNPLPTYDLSGLPVELTSNMLGFLPSFQVEDHVELIWKSGEYVFHLNTTTPMPGPQGEPGLDGSNVIPTAEAIAAEVSTEGTPTRAALDNLYVHPEDIEGEYEARQEAELATWSNAAANARITRANVLVVGDSISEGAWADTYFEGWTHVLGKYLQTGLLGSAGGEGYIPAIRGFNGEARGATLAQNGDRWLRTGSPTVDRSETNIGGLGRRSIDLSTTQTVSRTFYGDRVGLMFTGWIGGSQAKITVDGTVYTFVTDPGTGTVSGRMWTSPALTRGNHTVTVTSNGPGLITFDGGVFWDGDYTKGVTVWDGSHSSFRTDHFDGHDTASARWAGALWNVNPHLVIIALGTNDEHQAESGSYTPEIYGQRLGAMVDLIRSNASTMPSIAFLLQPTPGSGGGEDWWNRHRDAAIATAKAKGVALLDIKGRVPSGPPSGTTTYYADSNHPNSAGHRAYAGAVADLLEVPALVRPAPSTGWDETTITVANTSAWTYTGPEISSTVTVPASGRVLLHLTCRAANTVSNSYLGFAAEGANTIAATGNKSIRILPAATSPTGSMAMLLEGLNPGVTKFVAQPFVSSGSASFTCIGIIADPRT